MDKEGSSHLNILFLCGLFDEQQRRETWHNSKGNIQTAADVLQWSFVKALEIVRKSSLTIISSPFIGSFPFLDKRVLIRSRNLDYNSYTFSKQSGFVNLPILKHFFRFLNLWRHSRSWLKSKSKERLVILGYSLNFEIVTVLVLTKIFSRKSRVAVIIPDLPEFMNLTARRTSRIRVGANLKKSTNVILKVMLRYVDGYVLISENMLELLPKKPHLLLEGICPDIDGNHSVTPPLNFYSAIPKNSRIVLYSGVTNHRYGVLELCEAFSLIEDQDVFLVICGLGDASEEIRRFANRDKRIVYLGQVPRDQVIWISRRSTVLVNPRSNKEEFTKYSFPSKILEYMAVGKPVLSYKLDGIPSDYDPFLNYINSDGPEGLADALKEILCIEEDGLKKLGDSARSFARTQKNPETQGVRLIDFLHSL